ncbi:MAG: hypothetical protein M3400_01255, partial [Actinomycetota bacterium]|nr:hypothetical protein [Actinomycetota bacterium]
LAPDGFREAGEGQDVDAGSVEVLGPGPAACRVRVSRTRSHWACTARCRVVVDAVHNALNHAHPDFGTVNIRFAA